jgi:DNA-binding transcriptional LysR family regulator
VEDALKPDAAPDDPPPEHRATNDLAAKDLAAKDLNLLVTLDALLETGSVTGAAERLDLSPPAVSRALGRLRRTLRDPVLVRAGRGMRPTPRATALRSRVRALVIEAQDLLGPAGGLALAELERTFTLRGNDDVPMLLGARLTAIVAAEAPRSRLHFAPVGDERPSDLRDGVIDLDLGVPGPDLADLVIEPLLVVGHVAVVAADHPLATGPLTAARLARYPHAVVSRRGRTTGPLDDALRAEGVTRHVAATVPSAAAALALARSGTVVAIVADLAVAGDAAIGGAGLVARDLPVSTTTSDIAMTWHRRMDADAAHRWLRSAVRRSVETLTGRNTGE